MAGEHRYSVANVTQGKFRFYTLTVPSRVLAKTCYATTPDEDPDKGFQRVLERKRAQEIADYIDSGVAPIPTSIVLSAQTDANLTIIGRGKTVQFDDDRHAFLILDGQHRVYGFSLAKTDVRVPVVIFNGLTVVEESRLFIDINTKQRPVPNALLLAIKNLAMYETDKEALLRSIFDLFNRTPSSPLFGLMASATQVPNRISRVTFYAAMRTLLPLFEDPDEERIYQTVSNYVQAIVLGLQRLKIPTLIVKPVIFRAFVILFSDVAPSVRDRYNADYAVANFQDVVGPLFTKKLKTRLGKPGTSYQRLYEDLLKMLKQSQTL
jgi:DGQHR domain-containing protein